ncbi:EndoU domain-containing protein [Micromonospora sp. WMMC241]|uniref:EndoU domain-containing protein n=1 Tax=Micromonospora sp. WMMC241 TaxID=3015159 RepID=UPI0022B5EB9D|nr:EndoU domain-containing protein [Micromonospora sp. WMMC241]MCZ7435504.1 EndoU domain-containing protein [Micromonospora sp. WMMC241]
MRQLVAVLRTIAVLVVLFAVAGLHKHPSGPTPPHGGGDDGPKRPKFNPGMMPKRVGPAQQHGIKRAQEEGRPKDADTSELEAPKRTNPWDDPDFADARYDMRRFGQMGDGAMDKIWDGDGLGNGNHKPSSTQPGKTLFPPGTTKAQVEGWFKSIATNPDSRPQPRPHGDGWVVTGTRDGITCVVILDKDGSISGGYPVSGEGVTTNPA